ncbi:MAG: hypothetical protein IT371_18880 [Deltaproteobacteria bacterium]|nr:hypothetical protein [Deltaproteobacteria bacterium]
MAELKLLPLDEALSSPQLEKLQVKLAELGVNELPPCDDSLDLDEPLGETALADFMDRLEFHDVACHIYLPLEFDGRVSVGGQTIGSAHALAGALEDLREELNLGEEDGDEEEEDDDADELERVDQHLIYAWRAFAKAVNECLDRQIPLHVIA